MRVCNGAPGLASGGRPCPLPAQATALRSTNSGDYAKEEGGSRRSSDIAIVRLDWNAFMRSKAWPDIGWPSGGPERRVRLMSIERTHSLNRGRIPWGMLGMLVLVTAAEQFVARHDLD